MITVVMGQRAVSSVTDEEQKKVWAELFALLFEIAPTYNGEYYFETKSLNGKSALKRAENAIKKFDAEKHYLDIILIIKDNGETIVKKGEIELVKKHFEDIKKVVRFYEKRRKMFLKTD